MKFEGGPSNENKKKKGGLGNLMRAATVGAAVLMGTPAEKADAATVVDAAPTMSMEGTEQHVEMVDISGNYTLLAFLESLKNARIVSYNVIESSSLSSSHNHVWTFTVNKEEWGWGTKTYEIHLRTVQEILEKGTTMSTDELIQKFKEQAPELFN